MSRLLITISVVLAIFCAATLSANPKTKCPKNEEYKTCGTACPPTCEKPDPKICTDNCVIGCQCISGFVRNANDECVRLCDC